MPNVYELGDLVTVSGAFADSTGAAVDPVAVFCSYRSPATPTVTTTLTYGVDAALVKDSAGHYHANISATAVGTWHYRWYSTGTGQAADEGWFVVEESEFD